MCFGAFIDHHLFVLLIIVYLFTRAPMISQWFLIPTCTRLHVAATARQQQVVSSQWRTLITGWVSWKEEQTPSSLLRERRGRSNLPGLKTCSKFATSVSTSQHVTTKGRSAPHVARFATKIKVRAVVHFFWNRAFSPASFSSVSLTLCHILTHRFYYIEMQF